MLYRTWWLILFLPVLYGRVKYSGNLTVKNSWLSPSAPLQWDFVSLYLAVLCYFKRYKKCYLSLSSFALFSHFLSFLQKHFLMPSPIPVSPFRYISPTTLPSISNFSLSVPRSLCQDLTILAVD